MSIDETIRMEIRAAVNEILNPAIKAIIDCSIQGLTKEIADNVAAKILHEFSLNAPVDKNQHNLDDMLSEKEAAVILKKSPKTLRNYRYTLKRCEIPYRKEGGKILYKFADLIAYRDKNLRDFTPYQKQSRAVQY